MANLCSFVFPDFSTSGQFFDPPCQLPFFSFLVPNRHCVFSSVWIWNCDRIFHAPKTTFSIWPISRWLTLEILKFPTTFLSCEKLVFSVFEMAWCGIGWRGWIEASVSFNRRRLIRKLMRTLQRCLLPLDSIEMIGPGNKHAILRMV